MIKIKKKILFLIPSLSIGGAQRATIDIYNNLNRNLFSYKLCIATDQLNFLSDIKHKKEVISYKKKTTKGAMLSFLKTIYNEKPDLLVGIVNNANIMTGIAGLIYNIPFILVDHGDLLAFKMNNKSKKNWVKEIISWYLHKKANNSIVVSQELKFFLQKEFKIDSEKISLLNNPVNKKRIIKKSRNPISNKKFNSSKPKLINVGRLSPEKGHRDLIKATKYLVNKYDNIGVFIIGDGPERKKLNELINNNKLQNNIFLLGRKNNPYKYMKAGDVFILPSHREAYPITILEAGVCKIPIVTTDWDGVEDINKNSKKVSVSEKMNPIALSKKIDTIIKSKEKKVNMTENMFAFIKNMAPNLIAKKYEKIFNKVLKI